MKNWIFGAVLLGVVSVAGATPGNVNAEGCHGKGAKHHCHPERAKVHTPGDGTLWQREELKMKRNQREAAAAHRVQCSGHKGAGYDLAGKKC